MCAIRHIEKVVVEGYLTEECGKFCSRYLNDVETKYNRCNRNYVDLKKHKR